MVAVLCCCVRCAGWGREAAIEADQCQCTLGSVTLYLYVLCKVRILLFRGWPVVLKEKS